MKQLLSERIREHITIFEQIEKNENQKETIVRAAGIILDSLINGGALYLCGNGGSASDAQHIATEFVSRFYMERQAINAEALTVNTSSLTAIGNDYDFDRVFARQLEAKSHKGDVLIGITTSGTSKNVVRAMEYASKHGIHTILLTGNRDNYYDESIYKCVIKVPSEDTPRIQEAHIFIGHLLAEYVESEIARISLN